MSFCPRCGEKVIASEATSRHAERPKRTILKRIGYVVVGLLAVIGFSFIVETFTAESPTATPPPDTPLTPEQLATESCVADFTWAVDQFLDHSDPDQGLQVVVHAWGSQDERIGTAAGYYRDYWSYKNYYGHQQAIELVVNDMHLHCTELTGESSQEATCEEEIATALEIYAGDPTQREALLQDFTPEGQPIVAELMDYVSEDELAPADAPMAMGNLYYGEALCPR